MRLIVWIWVCLYCATLNAQDFYSVEKPSNLGQAIGQGAIDAYALRKQVDSLQEEVRRLTGENEALRAQLRQRDAQAEPTEAPPTIYLLSVPGCIPCDEAEAYHKPRYEAAGWVFKRQQAISGSVPRYRVCIGKLCEEFRCELMQLDARIEAIKAKQLR